MCRWGGLLVSAVTMWGRPCIKQTDDEKNPEFPTIGEQTFLVDLAKLWLRFRREIKKCYVVNWSAPNLFLLLQKTPVVTPVLAQRTCGNSQLPSLLGWCICWPRSTWQAWARFWAAPQHLTHCPNEEMKRQSSTATPLEHSHWRCNGFGGLSHPHPPHSTVPHHLSGPFILLTYMTTPMDKSCVSVCRKRTWLQAFHPINTIWHPQLLSWITRSSNHSAFTHSGPGLPHALRHYFAPSNTAFCAPPYYLALCSRDINISLHSAFVFVTLNKFRTITSMHLQTNPLLCNISEHVLDLFWLQLSLFSSVMYPKEDCSQLILR